MFENPTELVTAVETALQEPQHALPEAEARAVARTLYKRTDHDEDGKLFVRLGTGIRVNADASAAKLLTAELFQEATASQRAADQNRLVEQKRASGMYTGF